MDVTLRVSNEEKRKVQDVYRRNLAAGAKQAILLGNLEVTAQRVIKAEHPLDQEALTTYLPYLTAERYASDKGGDWDLLIFGIFLIAVVGSLFHSDYLGIDYWAFPGMYWLWYIFVCKRKRSYREVWVHGSTNHVLEEVKVEPVNHEKDPLISFEPMSEPTVGDFVHGRLPDGTHTERPRGVQIAHAAVPIELHEDCPGNIQRAIDERITAKQRKPSMTRQDKIAIKATARKFAVRVFTREAVQEAMLNIGSLEDCKSKKWTQNRFDQAYLQALNSTSDEFMLKCSIKNEPIPEGKPPRMIVADGDPGQVMALASLSVMEYILFHRYLDRSVKHTAKADAMERVIASLNKIDNYSVVEADGSAWDTCCQKEVRDLTENAIMEHLWRTMKEVGVDENGFEDRHMNTNTAAFLRLLKTCPDGAAMFIVEAIRRSGHRGTSVLNWLINHVLTLVSVNPTGRGDLLEAEGYDFIDRWGNKRRARFAHEGDDTIYTISPPLSDKETKDIVAFWERCGFNMKLFVRDKVAEFTGWKIPIVAGRLEGDQATPDFIRSMKNGCITCSGEAIRGDYKMVAASKFASYSMAYANVLPTVSEMYKNWAEAYGFNGRFTDDDVRGFGGTVPDTMLGLFGVMPDEEEQTLRNLGVLRNKSYEDFVADVLSQRHDMPNEWLGELAYWE